MLRRMRSHLLTGILLTAGWLCGGSASVQAQEYNLNNYYYYPYHFFKHNYWPMIQPPWPERTGEPYRRPPAYMAYPPFHEPHWRYELNEPMSYYRGFHFWLDQF